MIKSDTNSFVVFVASNCIAKQLLVIVHVRLGYGGDASLFRKLCQNVHKLFGQQVAPDVKISFKSRIHRQSPLKQYASKYSSYFQIEEFGTNCNEPQCKSH